MILTLKLSSGDLLIGKVEELNNDVEMEKPVGIFFQQTEQGEMGLAFFPFMPFCDKPITINKAAIVATGIPNDDLINQYNLRFGSNLIIAK